MIIDFITNISFNKDSSVSPDDYYLEKCIEILKELSKNKEYVLREIDGGGYGGQGCGNLWIAYEYFENEIKKEIIVSVTYEDILIVIKINFENNCENENDILLREFINILKTKLVEK